VNGQSAIPETEICSMLSRNPLGTGGKAEDTKEMDLVYDEKS